MLNKKIRQFICKNNIEDTVLKLIYRQIHIHGVSSVNIILVVINQFKNKKE